MNNGRSPYRQRSDKRLPRAIPDHLCDEVYAALRSDRDRAIVSLLLSGAARATELLGMTGQDVDWGRKCVRLVTKGTRIGEWVAASPAFFRWLMLYLTERGPVAPTESLWLTLREPHRPLTYSALRAVITRVNERLGSNLVLHDFRHTCAIRLASDPRVPITDVQTHLRHKHLSSTETYLIARPEEVIGRVQAHHRATTPEPSDKKRVGWTYDATDLHILLGGRGEAS
jgi:integrase/recombinase XerD